MQLRKIRIFALNNSDLIKLSDIKANPNNPRVVRDERFEKLCKSIAEFPKMMSLRPIVVDADNVVLGGNMRLRALQHLKFKEVPDNWIRRADDLTEDEQRRFIIADNVGFGEWDWSTLANEWEAEELEDWGLEIPDFAGEETESEAKEDNYQMQDNIQVDVVLGDLIEIGPHRLLCGDSTDSDTVARLMNLQKAHMVFTDPPHDVEQDDIVSFLAIFCDGVKFVLHNDTYLAKLAAMHIDRFERFLVHDFIFHIGGGNRFFTQNDLIACFDYDGDSFNNLHDGFSTVIRKMTERQKGTDNLAHPHQKPVYLVEQFIAHFSNTNQIVLDLYLGSGTTMVTAHQLNRKCYGLEIDPKNCQVIIDRMVKLDPNLTVLINGKPYLKTVEKQS